MREVSSYNTIDEVPELENINILTWFRPSTAPNQTQWSDFTLGHMVQIQQVLDIHTYGEASKIPTQSSIIIADMQWFSDNPTREHLQDIKKYTALYCANVLACFEGSENVAMFRESRVYTDIIQPLSHFIWSNIGYNAVDENLVADRVSTIQGKYWKTITDARMRWDFIDQAAHAMSANANIIPAWANQLSAFWLFNQAVETYHKNGFTYPFEREIVWLTANGYLIWPDGKKMSTSKGNAVEISIPLDELDQIVINAHEDFLVSIAVHFGDSNEFDRLIKRWSKVAYIQSLLRKKLEPIQEKYYELRSKPHLIEETMIQEESSYKQSAQKIVDGVNVFNNFL